MRFQRKPKATVTMERGDGTETVPATSESECGMCSTSSCNATGPRKNPVAECALTDRDGRKNIIRAQFDTKIADSTTGFSIQVAPGYLGQPLVTEAFVKRMRIRQWKSREPRNIGSRLPDGTVAVCSSIVIAKLQVEGRFYRVEFGILAKGTGKFRENGWGQGEKVPDAVVGDSHFCRVNLVAEGF